jgi:hypothetical protein
MATKGCAYQHVQYMYDGVVHLVSAETEYRSFEDKI